MTNGALRCVAAICLCSAAISVGGARAEDVPRYQIEGGEWVKVHPPEPPRPPPVLIPGEATYRTGRSLRLTGIAIGVATIVGCGATFSASSFIGGGDGGPYVLIAAGASCAQFLISAIALFAEGQREMWVGHREGFALVPTPFGVAGRF